MLGRQVHFGEGRAGLFRISRGPPHFYLFVVLHVGLWPPVGVSLNIMIKLAASGDMK